MKRNLYNILIFIFLIAPVIANAQSREIDKIFGKFSGKEGITTVVINEDMFRMASDMFEEGTEKSVIEGIKGLRILEYKYEQDMRPAKSFYDEIVGTIPLHHYQELLNVQKENEKVKILIKKQGERIKELLLLSYEDDKVILINIFGDLDLQKVLEMSRKMKIKNLEELEKLEDAPEKGK